MGQQATKEALFPLQKKLLPLPHPLKRRNPSSTPIFGVGSGLLSWLVSELPGGCVKWFLLVAGGDLRAGESWLKPLFFLPDPIVRLPDAERPWTNGPCKSESSAQLTASPYPPSPRTEFSSP